MPDFKDFDTRKDDKSYLLELIEKDMTQKIVENAIERTRPQLVDIAKQIIREMNPQLVASQSAWEQDVIMRLVIQDPVTKEYKEAP